MNNQRWHKITWNAKKAPLLTKKKQECDVRFLQASVPGEFTRWVIQICEAALTAAQEPNGKTGKVEIDPEVFANLKGWGDKE